MSSGNLGECFAEWAQRERAISGLILIGSRVRSPADALWAPDAHSDWDFLIIADRPGAFLDSAWAGALAGAELRVYAVRPPRLGVHPKINMVFADTEADAVVIPTKTMRLAKLLVALGLHRRAVGIQRRLQDMSLILRPGWKLLKGQERWEVLCRKVVAEVPDHRLTEEEVRRLADIFVCDYVSLRRKIVRGELRAAQRMLHRELAETNFRLLHEMRLRGGMRSFPDARRMERTVDAKELAAVSVEARLDAAELETALEHCAAALRELTGALIGDRWRWPDVS